MKHKRAILTTVMIVIVIGICGYAFYWQAKISAEKLTDQNCASVSSAPAGGNNTPAATIDGTSLTAQSESPTITGKFSDAGVIDVFIWKGRLVLPPTLIDTNLVKQAVWNDFSDHGGQVLQCPIGSTSGRYSDEVDTPLQEGDYTVGIYTYHTIYTDAGYQGDTTAILLATGILKVAPN